MISAIGERAQTRCSLCMYHLQPLLFGNPFDWRRAVGRTDCLCPLAHLAMRTECNAADPLFHIYIYTIYEHNSQYSIVSTPSFRITAQCTLILLSISNEKKWENKIDKSIINRSGNSWIFVHLFFTNCNAVWSRPPNKPNKNPNGDRFFLIPFPPIHE